MIRCALAGVMCGVLLWGAMAEAAAPPGKTRNLTEEESKELAAIESKVNRQVAAGEFEQAAKLAKQIAEFRRQRQGAQHWQAIDARYSVERWQRGTKVPRANRAEVLQAWALDAEGVTLLGRGRFREAEKSLRRALLINEKVLGKEHPDTATSYNNLASCLQDQGKAGEALPLYRQALLINEKVLGREHPNTATDYSNVASCLNAQGKHGEALRLYRQALLIEAKVLGLNHPSTATSYNNVASCLQDQGKLAEALPLYRRALLIRERVLSLDHSHTAQSYNNVASCLQAQGKAVEALPLFRKALLIFEKVLGRDHPSTAANYNNVAGCLQAQGKVIEALPLYRQALLIREKVLGLNHPHTAASYNNVASCLQEQGKTAEALPLYRQALLIWEKLLGLDHPYVALGYNNVASCLNDQGKTAEALPLYRKGLRINQRVLGSNHPLTATSSNNVAFCLQEQGKAAEALVLFREALLIQEKVLGEAHPHTARSYNNVASCLQVVGKVAEALALHHKALLIWERVLGRDHPYVAASYTNVAICLQAQGKLAEALPLYCKALSIEEKVLGMDHPFTALSYNNVAHSLWKQERRNEAILLWQQSLRGQEAARVTRADTGFDRAQGGTRISVQAALAVGLAHLKQPRNAFRHADASLARGLLDDLAGLTQTERDRSSESKSRLAKLESELASFSARDQLTDEQAAHQKATKREYGQLWRERSELFAAASERVLLPLERIQKAIPADAALMFWVTELEQRWVCIVRTGGAPTWRQLPNRTDARLADQFYRALLDPGSAANERKKHLDAFRKEWLDSLRPHLKGVKQLFVVPTGALAHIPADLLADDFAIRYVPSGSFLARTIENHRALDASSLLAIGDPIFAKSPPPDPPKSGVFVLSVLPGSFASKVGLQSGDVLLSIAKTTLESIDDIQGALSSLPANADVWRDGKTFAVRLQGSPLGAVFDKRSARAAVRALRRDREALAQRGTGHKRLPGTRLEVEAISAMVKGSNTLLGSDASEQKLDALLASGKLKDYRLVHFATHGEPNTQIPKQSALILAQDNLPHPVEQAKHGLHVYDGRLTVERIRRKWKGKLDADLVVLSACETGLGKEAKGDGLLGFAQAFLSIGARSVVLSRWKVDDTATSLLMIRLYENLLGKRKGVKPMGRAASLDEAKKWLSNLTRKEAERLATLHTGGVLRGSEGTEKTPDKAKKVEYKGDTPFAHPYYWAAWTLVGDPD